MIQSKLAEIVTNIGKNIRIKKHSLVQNGEWHGSQLKTKADIFAHNLFVEKLNTLEKIPIISEEDYRTQIFLRPDRYWLIDPIDGTRSLVDGYPGWVTQAALIENGYPVVSAIYAPDLDQLYTASVGNGAYLNGVKLTSKYDNNNIRLIDNYAKPHGIAYKVMKDLNCADYIECGSISLKICKVADNTADLFVKDVFIRDWDIGAPMLILNESDGFISNLNGSPIELSGSFEKKGVIASTSKSLIYKVSRQYGDL
jgi:3'(2'), 5'-bisphosphate nucleotidase/myo-inositol-1(or 4)-monophosphatase